MFCSYLGGGDRRVDMVCLSYSKCPLSDCPPIPPYCMLSHLVVPLIPKALICSCCCCRLSQWFSLTSFCIPSNTSCCVPVLMVRSRVLPSTKPSFSASLRRPKVPPFTILSHLVNCDIISLGLSFLAFRFLLLRLSSDLTVLLSYSV